MVNKLAKLIAKLDYKDLQLLKKDYDAGNIEKLINFHLKESKKNHKTTCPVCGGIVSEGVGFHLQFGPPELRKKATFDGIDCMHYFLENMKKKSKISEEDNIVIVEK